MAAAIPQAIPVEDSEFQISEYWGEFLFENLDQEELNMVYDVFDSDYGLQKRDEQTIATILNYVNESQIIFKVLDQVAGHPDRISTLANLTGALIKSLNGTISLSALEDFAKNSQSSINITAIIDTVVASGIVKNLLDGILLDENFRPKIVDLIYRIVISNKSALWFIVNGVLAKREYRDVSDEEIFALIKRATNENQGTLATFASNIVGTVLQSSLVANISVDTLNALNDTGFLTYTVKKLIGTESYQNLTVDFAKDLYNTGAIDLSSINLSAINISAIVGTVLSDPDAIASAVGKLLSGKLDLSIFGPYASAVGSIIKDLESKGLFKELNDFLFPSSTTTQAPKTTSADKKEAVITSTTGSVSFQLKSEGSTTAGSGASFMNTESNVSIIKMLLFVQSFVFGGALLLI
ncbi:uncharacterized protein RJT20DRAFT_133104 [Scheffersomyces xylosifermentans]|uniref:uncharacterized protein n=1 Tax=Scheffersomyces xylosifermentans TaxID=1304137 RepID=UPI00315DC44A